MKRIDVSRSPEQAAARSSGAPVRTVAVFDLDGTLTRFDSYLPFLAYVCWSNPVRILSLPRLIWFASEYARGKHGNDWLKQQFWSAIAGGLPCDHVKQLGKRFADILCRYGVRKGGVTAVSEHKQAGHHTVLVSASFDVYVEEIANQLGFDAVICTRSEQSPENTVTGNIDGNNCYGEEKIHRLRGYLESRGAVPRVIAYSDHHSDVPILTWADRGIAVYPTGKLRKIVAETSLEEISDW